MYSHIVVGGTFDGLHKGHVYFLRQSFASANHVTIGLTSEAYIRRYKSGSGVRPYSKRFRDLTSWLRKLGLAQKARIVPLDNKWGPVLLPDDFDAIAVTSENIQTAKDINSVRAERGLSELALVEIDLIESNDAKVISSSRIRNGEIDKKGNLILPDSLRSELQKLLGEIVPVNQIKAHVLFHKDDICIAVGDVATETLFYCGIQPSLAIIDLRVERKPYQVLKESTFPKKYSVLHAQSGPGYISSAALLAIKKWKAGLKSRKRVALVIKGEEDLLVLPAIIEAPIGSYVYYGSPPSSGCEGLVEVCVTARTKDVASGLLSQFIAS